MFFKVKQGNKLKEQAEKLGVSSLGDRIRSDTSARHNVDEHVLQKRVLEAMRHRRDSWVWIIAVISSTASVISALAAWYAVGQNNLG